MSESIQGLTSAQVKERREKGLGNTAQIQSSRSYGQILRENVFTFINNVLFALGIALVLLGQISDALVSVGVIFLNIIVSLVQEVRAKRTLDRIALLTRPKAVVLRDGKTAEVDPSELVVGDILKISAGDQIVLDGRQVSEARIEVDESLLSGESDLVPKVLGSPVYSGSFCVNGSAFVEVEKVGAESLAQKITAGARAFRRMLTPIQRETNLVVRIVLLIASFLLALLLVDTILNDIPIVESVKMSIVIAGLVPNGLFVAITISYALGAVRIAGKGALVQQSNAVESLSNVTVLCLDKTGTLTANRIRFHDVIPFGITSQRLRSRLAIYAASGSTGNRTSEALAEALPGEPLPVLDEVPFSSDRKWSALSFDTPELRGTYVMGALEMLQPVLQPNEELAEPAESWSDQGLRVVLLAYLPEPAPLRDSTGQPVLPTGLESLGLISFSDELRPEARKTLSEFAAAGVALKIISGDNPHTVASLARQAGLSPQLKVISGLELAEMQPEEFSRAAQENTIFGRITPQQKEQLVLALRGSGEYVAMIGDGVNDVLSLKQANLGIAMQSGSQAARAVADIVLLKDSFAVLPSAVREGQRIINGMQDILKLYLSRIFYLILMVVATSIIGGFPFSPKHSSIVALMTVGIPAIALAAWARPGKTPRGSFMRRLLHFVLPAALLMILFGLGVYLGYLAPALQRYTGTHAVIVPQEIFKEVFPIAQTALSIFTIFAGLLLIIFVEPPTPWFEGGDVCRKDRRPAFMALAMALGFIGFLAAGSLSQPFDFIDLKLADYLLIGGAALLMGLALRFAWRKKLLDRFFEVNLQA